MVYYITDSYFGSGDTLPLGSNSISEEEYKKLLNDFTETENHVNKLIKDVIDGITNLDDLKSDKYYDRIKNSVNDYNSKNCYGIPYEIYNQILDDYTEELIEDGVIS